MGKRSKEEKAMKTIEEIMAILRDEGPWILPYSVVLWTEKYATTKCDAQCPGMFGVGCDRVCPREYARCQAIAAIARHDTMS